jgi:hypothetical protein
MVSGRKIYLLGVLMSGSVFIHAEASCIQDEMKKQMLNMHEYVPAFMLKPLKDAGVLDSIKEIVDDQEKWKVIQAGAEGYARDFRVLTERKKNIEKARLKEKWEYGSLSSYGESIGVWEMIVGQSALRCIEKGVDP